MTINHTIEKVILFNDIIGSTKQWNKYGNRMLKEIERVTTIVNNLLKKTNGVLIKMVGDSYMIAFDELLDSIVFAVKFDDKLNNTKSLLDKRLLFRTGIYYGKVIEKHMKIQKCIMKDFFGSVVKIASRLESKVSDENSIAIGIKTHKILTDVLNFLKDKKYKYEIIDFEKTCKKHIQNNNITSKKFLASRHIHERCKSLKKLKGVAKNITVLKIMKK